MNITRRTTRIASTILAGLSLAALGGGIASAAPTPDALHESSTTQSNDVIDWKLDSAKIESWNGFLGCGTYNPGYPYLVLDSVGDNSSRLFRHVTFNTGDNRPLAVGELIVPVSPGSKIIGMPNSDEYYKGVDLSFSFEDKWPYVGHGSLTIKCAKTPEAANQK